MTAEENLARRQRLATLRLGFIAVVVLIGLIGWLAWHLANPDPEDVVRDQFAETADYLGHQASYAVADSTSAEEAQERFGRAGTSFRERVRYWVLEGRVVGPDTAQWDVVLSGSAYPFLPSAVVRRSSMPVSVSRGRSVAKGRPVAPTAPARRPSLPRNWESAIAPRSTFRPPTDNCRGQDGDLRAAEEPLGLGRGFWGTDGVSVAT